MKNTITLEIAKDEFIRVSPREYKDKQYVDIRVWFKAKNEDTLLPTRKGFALKQHIYDELICELVRGL